MLSCSEDCKKLTARVPNVAVFLRSDSFQYWLDGYNFHNFRHL